MNVTTRGDISLNQLSKCDRQLVRLNASTRAVTLLWPLSLCLLISACGSSLPNLAGPQPGQFNLQTSSVPMQRVGLGSIVGPPPMVSERMGTELVELAANNGMVLFRNPSIAQPKNLQIDLQAERVADRVHFYYRTDVLDDKGQVVERLKGEEVVEMPPPPVAATLKTVKVRKGDTLSKIAQQHGVTVAQLKSANKLKNSFIKIGQELQVGAQPVQPPPPADVWQNITAAHTLLIGQKILGAVKTMRVSAN